MPPVFIEVSSSSLPQGFCDKIGNSLRKRRLVELVFREEGNAGGYEEIETPILEFASDFYDRMFSKSQVFFKFEIQDFDSSDKIVGKSKVLLRPEGTIPVCRYLANELSRGSNDVLPKKLFYNVSCYRNEAIEELDGSKKREFNQLGVEIIGNKGFEADAEAIHYAFSVLRKIGIQREDIRVRINDVSIFKELCEKTDLPEESKIYFQGLIDSFSKKQAEGKTETTILPLPKGLDRSLELEWSRFLSSYMRPEKALISDKRLNNIYLISELINDVPIVVDRSVVRGFRYYTGPVFQIDVRKNGIWKAEVGGGGRYDSLLGTYLAYFGIKKEVPATGFAFGTERITELANFEPGFKMTVTR